MGAALNPQLSLLEARVLGVLLEKELTVPDIYPLSLNALTSGQPEEQPQSLLNASEADVQAAIDRLKPLSLVIESSGSGHALFAEHRPCAESAERSGRAAGRTMATRPADRGDCERRPNGCIASPMPVRSKASWHNSPNVRPRPAVHWYDCCLAHPVHASNAGRTF